MAAGLDGIIAADTRLSDVQGEAGRLIIRGFDLQTLVNQHHFETVAALLFDGFFEAMPDDFRRALGQARSQVFTAGGAWDTASAELGTLEAMRALTARLADDHSLETALQLLAAPAVFSTARLQIQVGQRPIEPDPERGHAEDIMRMLRGQAADPAEVEALDRYLVTVCDHGLNASTFAARVVASTQSGLTSSVLAAIGALKGPLHGGAPGPVIAMLNAIGSPDKARTWIAAALDRGERLMGFGHRIYRVRDPRADVLKRAAQKLAAVRPGLADRLALAEAVQSAALAQLHALKPDRPLDVNVEFYTALLLEALGFPPEAFTAVFAMGRVAGWIAHAREQGLTGRLIRPQSRYIGPMPKAAA